MGVRVHRGELASLVTDSLMTKQLLSHLCGNKINNTKPQLTVPVLILNGLHNWHNYY